MTGTGTDTEPSEAPKPPRRRRGRLRRWLVRLVILAVVLRVGLAFALEPLIEYGVGFAGLDATCGSASLSLLGGSLRLQRVTLTDPDGGPDALQVAVHELAVDVSTWQLLFGELVFSDAVLRGAHVELHHRADGTLVLPAQWQAASAPPPAPPPSSTPTAPPGFELPFSVASARIHDLRLRILDASSETPPLEYVLDADIDHLGRRDVPADLRLRLSSSRVDQVHFEAHATPTRTADASRLELAWTLQASGLDLRRLLPTTFLATEPLRCNLRGTLAATRPDDPSAPTRLEAFAAVVDSPELAGQLELRADGAFGGSSLDAAVVLSAEKLALRPLRPWFERHGIAIEDDGVGLAATVRVQSSATGELAAELSNFEFGSPDRRLRLARAGIEGLRFGDNETEIGAIRLDGPSAQLVRLPDGSLSVAGLRLGGGAPSESDTMAEPAAASEPAGALILRVLQWRNAALSYTDLGLGNSPTLELADLVVDGHDLAFAIERPPGGATLALRLPGVADQVTAEVRVEPRAGGGTIAADFVSDGMSLAALEPWLRSAGIAPALTNGRLSFGSRVDLDGETVSASLANLRLADGDEVLLSLRNAELTGFDLAHPGLAFARLQVDEPVALVLRDAEATTVAGLRFQARPAAAAAPAGIGAPAANAEPLALATGAIELRGAAVRLRENRPDAPTVTVGLDLAIGAMTGAGRTAWVEPVPIDVAIHLEQRLDTLRLHGEASRRDDLLTVTAQLQGSGIRGEALDPLLPGGWRSSLSDGAMTADLRLEAATDFGAFDLALANLLIQDRGEELAAVDLVALEAAELSATRIHLAAVRVEGIRALITSTPDGLLIPGLLLEPAAEPATTTTGEPAPPAAVAPPSAAVWPALQLDEFVLAGSDLAWRDRRAADAEPLRMSWRLALAEPWASAEELEESPPLRWQFDGAAEPWIAKIAATAAVQPFTIAPEFELHLEASGIDTTALARVSPTLAESIDGTETAAALRLHLHTTIALSRSNAETFDFSRPFGATVLLTDCELSSTTEGPLLKIPNLEAEVRAFDPRTGDVLLRSLELDSPQLRARRTPAGFEIGGLLLRNPPTPTGTTEGEAAGVPPPPPVAVAAAPAPELAIDDLRIYGLDFTWRDTTTDPATLLPIEQLDLAVTRWSTKASTEPRQFAFEASMRGGPVPLTKRIVRSSLLAGIAGAAADLVTGQLEHKVEQRPLFDEFRIAGHLQLFPQTMGRITSSIRGFELPSLRGLAKTGGVDITDGVIDSDLDIDIAAKGAKVRNNSTFTWLQISEPPGGPISTYLKLPAPLDVVLFVLRNDNDEQRVPLRVAVPADGLSSGAIASEAVEALTLLIGEAIRSSPWRVGRTVTDLIGLSGRGDLEIAPVELRCAAGSADPDMGPLTAWLGELGGDETVALELTHELSAADLERVTALANPDRALAERTVTDLRQQRDRLVSRRDRLAAEVTARLLASQVHAARPQLEALQDLDRELALVQNALDQALALFDGDTPRHRRRRARAASLGLAELRLDAARLELGRRLGPGAQERIELRAPRVVVAEGLTAGGRVVVSARRTTP